MFRINEKPNQRVNVFAPDNSEKLRDLETYFFLEKAERPKEAPDSSLEKKVF
jgi:hypothetical protein